MKIGLLLPTREAVMYGDHSGDPRPLVDLAVQAEDMGFDSVWAGDSLLARPRADPLTLLAGVATRTERVELGTAVLLPALRNPEQLAQAVGTVDALSGGRFILGVGAGPGTPGVKADHEYVDVDFDHRAGVMMDVLARVQSLWSGRDGDQMYPLPVSSPAPPIWMGGSGPRTLGRAGEHCDGWFPLPSSVEAFAAGVHAVRQRAEAAGRAESDVTMAAYLTVTFGQQATAEAELKEHSELYYGVPHEIISKQHGSIAGPRPMVLEWLQEFIEAGATHLCIRIGSADINGQLEVLADSLDELKG